MKTDLSGKVALVNGGSRGIGEAVAHGLAECGAHVVLSSRSLEGVQAVADAIIAKGGKASAAVCHAGELEQIEALMGKIGAEFGRLDILINNAATSPHYGPAHELPVDAFDQSIQVNLKGPYYFMTHAVPLMIKNGGGRIVNVASIAGLAALPGAAVYSMTKAGLMSLTRSFAKEYGHSGIRVNALLPGVTETKFAEALTADPKVQKWMASSPAGRAGQPEDMVGAVLYLVSDEAAYTTGVMLQVDGGAML